MHANPRPSPVNHLEDEGAQDADPIEGWEVGKYQVIRRLSSGGTSPDRLLAVQNESSNGSSLVVLTPLQVPDDAIEHLMAQSQLAERFRHPQVTSVLGCEMSSDGIYWVTEFTAGVTLAELVTACREQTKTLPVGVLLGVLEEVARGLGAVHASPISAHGFVKPDNVLITFDGTAKLLDFGLASFFARARLGVEMLPGMAPYAAPEQTALSFVTTGARSDIFSLSVILHDLISGTPYFPASTTFEQRAKMPERPFRPLFDVVLGRALDDILKKGLNPDRLERHLSGEQWADEVHRMSEQYLWRPAMRANYLGRMFPTRKRRFQVLLSSFVPENQAELSVSPVQPVTPPPVTSPPVTSQSSVVVSHSFLAEVQDSVYAPPKPPPASGRKSQQPRRKRVLRLAKAWVAGGVLCVIGIAPRLEEAAPPVAAPVSNVRLYPSLKDAQKPVSEDASFLTALAPASPEKSVPKTRRRPKSKEPLPPWLKGTGGNR